MELLRWELRKIWRPGVLAAIVLLGAVYYWMFPEFYMEYFRKGPESSGMAYFALASEWVERYGPTLEGEEWVELEERLAEEIAAFDRQVAAIPEAAAAGITSYEAFLTLREDDPASRGEEGEAADKERRALIDRVYGETNWYIVGTLESYLEDHETAGEEDAAWRLAQMEALEYSEAMIRREWELASWESGSLLPGVVTKNTREYSKDLAVWCVLSVILLLSPTLARDRLRGVRPTQWSSRRGRDILRTQMVAAFLSALALTAANVLVYTVPFLSQGPLRFAACPWSGWFDWTYGTYLLALAGLIFSLSLGAAALTVFLSQYSENYVATLLKALPLFVVEGALLGNWMLQIGFSFQSVWIGALDLLLWMPKGTETAIAAALLLLGAALCALACRRQRRGDLLS